jgi:hypothetical protein
MQAKAIAPEIVRFRSHGERLEQGADLTRGKFLTCWVVLREKATAGLHGSSKEV